MNQRRKIVSRGTALVDPRAAVERLRSFQLAEPLLYVLEIVRAAVAGGATAVDLFNDADDLVLTFDGAAPSADDLAHLLDHLFSTTHPRLRLLAIAVNTALGFGPRHVDLYTTHEAPAGQCHRVRFTAGVSHDPDARVPAALESARVELVARPADLPPDGVRVHLRESFGMPVVREWFARDPAETVLLRDRLVALPIPLRRDGVALPTGFVPPALVSVPLDLGADLRGSLQLVDAFAGHRLVLSELGVILESRALAPVGHAAAPFSPLRLHLDARSLPTNASRSQVDLSGGLLHALRRAWNAQLPQLLDATRARLDDPSLPEPERIALHEALLVWLHHCLGDTWLSNGLPAAASLPSEAELGVATPAVATALLEWALIPTATGPLVSAASLCRLVVPPHLVWRGAGALPAELAPHLGAVLWCPPRRHRLDALLRPMALQPSTDAVERAREAQTRRQRFLGLTPREPRVPPVDDAVLRAPLGDASADEPPALPVALPGLRGELLIRARGLDASGVLLTTVFIEQRPLPPEALDTAGVPAEVALEHPALRANQNFHGVESNAALGQAMRAVKLSLAEGLAVLADELAGALGLDDPRRQWLGPALDDVSPDTRRAMVRAVFDTLRGAAATPAEARSLADDALRRHPSLAELPVWPTVARDTLASTGEVRVMVDAPGGCVLVSLGPRGRGRADGRTVLLVDAAGQRTLAAMLPATARFVDLTGTLPTRVTPDPRTLVSLDDRRAVPWMVVASAHTRVAIAPSPSTKESFTLAHGGVALDGRKFRGRFGPVQVVAEDDRIIVLPGAPAALPESVPADLDALVAAAELSLVGTLALAWRGDDASADALGGRDEEIRSVPARRMLLAALAHVTAHPDDASLGPLREALEGTPMIPARRVDGAVEELTPAALRARLPERSGATYPFLAEPPADLAGEDFSPLIVPDREHRAHLERALGVKLRSAHEQLPPLRDARARRLARARLAGRPPARPDDLGGFALGASARSLSRQDLGALHAAVAREAASARVEVLVDGVVAFALDGDALPLPVVGRLAPDDDAALTTSLDALSDAGRKAFGALLTAMVPALLEAALDDADGGRPPAAGLPSLCLRWALSDGAKALARQPALRERLRRLPMWRSPAGERISLSQLTLFTPRPAWCRERATPWIAAEPGDEPDLAAVVLEREDDARGLGALVGELPVEVTAEVERLQRRRALRASGGTAVRLPGEPGCASLAVRIESVAPKLGFGELRLVEGEAALTLRVHAPGSSARVLTLPSPFALSAALACPDLDARDVDKSVQTLELGTRLQEAARALLLRAAGTAEALPRWSDPALRWALLTTRGVEGAALGRGVFTDTQTKPMTLADLAAQEATHRAVSYCTLEPDEPCALGEEGVRAVVLSTREAAWLQTLRKGRDVTAAVRIALRALAWDRSPPASRIEPPVDGSVQVRLRCPITAAGREGEVCWLDSDAPAGSTVAWYRSRRRLGESAIELPWPARMALEAPGLTPDATRTAPVPDLALAQARQQAIDLALGTLRRALGPTEREAPLGTVAAHDPKSPAWHGGQANAVGWLWLCADGAPGSVEVTAGERSMIWKARSGGKYPCAAPLTGRLWLHRGARERLDEVLEAVVGWAWRRLLDVWSGAAGIDVDAPAQAVLLTRAALAGALTGATMRDVAKTLRLPGTRTTFQQLQTARKDERALRVVPPGDGRLDKAYFVPESAAPWMAVLREAAMLTADEPVVAVAASAPAAKEREQEKASAARPTATKAARPEAGRAAEAPARRDDPAKKVSAARAAAWPWAARVESELRAMALAPEMLHAVEGTEAAAGGRDPMVEYAERERVAKVAVRHPVVARWLAGDPRRGATLLAMAVYGAIHRARADLTVAEECAAMDATLGAIAGRQGK
jgi:hypothetical protein